MEYFWRRKESKPAAVDTQTKAPLARPRKMDIDDYFAMNSLLESSDLEEDLFLKAQKRRKHRVVRSLGDTRDVSANFMSSASYEKVNMMTLSPADRHKEGRNLQCENLLGGAAHAGAGDEHHFHSNATGDRSTDDSQTNCCFSKGQLHHHHRGDAGEAKKNKTDAKLLPPLTSSSTLSSKLKCCQEKSLLASPQNRKVTKLTVEEGCDENQEMEIKDSAATDEESLLDLNQDYSDLPQSNHKVPSSFSPVGRVNAISNASREDGNPHEEEDMEKASLTSSSFFMRPSHSMITSTSISQLLWRGNSAAQKYLQVSHASPDTRAKKSLWTF